MKKEDIAGLIVYLIIIAVVAVFGFAILQPHFAKSTFNLGIIYALFILGAIALGIVASAVLLELGHLLGAKIGGYEILSVNMLWFCFYKDEGKTKFRFSNFDGLVGETKILPKSEKSNPRPYLLFPTLFLSLFLIVCVFLFFFNKDFIRTIRGDFAYFFLTSAVVSGISLFYNILPFKLDSINDGYYLAMTSNPRNKEAFNELLRVEHELAIGNNDVEIKTFTELTNFTAELNTNKVYVLLDKKQYAEADELLDIVLKNKDEVSHKIFLRAIAMKVYINAVSKSIDEAKEYMKENIDLSLRKELETDDSLSSIRAYILIEGLLDNSKSECMLVISKVAKVYNRTSKNRLTIEAELYNSTLDIVGNEHPKWELEKYKLTSK